MPDEVRRFSVIFETKPATAAGTRSAGAVTQIRLAPAIFWTHRQAALGRGPAGDAADRRWTGAPTARKHWQNDPARF